MFNYIFKNYEEGKMMAIKTKKNMETNKIHFEWNIIFFSGVAVISLINIGLILLHKNQLAYDFWILGVSIIVLIVFTLILIKRKK